MFNSIKGRLTEKRADSICIDTGGIEWEIHCPARALEDFGVLGSEARSFTWLHHYEDGMRLYGFPSDYERRVFLELMKVEGIGPKQALKVLSGLPPEALERALEAEDLAALQSAPGVGPKLAQKMLLALKGKLVRNPEPRSGPGASAAKPWADVVRALAEMGFDRKDVERVVAEKAAGLAAAGGAKAGQASAGGDAFSAGTAEKELFRLALLELSSGA